IVANINVMYHGDDLKNLINNSGAKIIVTLDLFVQNALKIIKDTSVENIIIHSVMGVEKTIEKDKDVPELIIFNDLVSSQSTSEPNLDCANTDIAVLQYTSGATGMPKAVSLTHQSIISNVIQISSWNPVIYDENPSVICILPFFHVFGMTVCLHVSVFKGYRMILLPMFDWSNIVDILDLLKKYRPISFPAVPTLWAALVSYPNVTKDHFSSIEIASGGGSPMPVWVQEKYKKLTGKCIVEAYGLSEASSSTHINPFHGRALPGSIGIPLPDTDAMIVDIEKTNNQCPIGDVGELAVKGPQIMNGYWENPELTKKALHDGWLYTGDLARMDKNGFFFLIDRKDDMILSKGFNVYPTEVEKILAEHKGVKEACVVGLPDRFGGSSITAFLVLEKEASADKKELLDYCREKLPAFKMPKIIKFIDEIPKNRIGKPLRRILREQENKIKV
ncbi:MAG: AMP-binding protein, partial [Desulfobacterales bacterium]|nr:AMP-binding protein [Desulfobacterales bacterium]